MGIRFFCPEAKKLLSGVEAVVFDVDGVLVDTRRSFRETILTSARIVLGRWHGVEGPPATSHQTDLFKQIPGFNDDYDITIALTAFWEMKRLLGGGRPATTKALAPFGPTLSQVLERAERSGGGLGAFLHCVESYAPEGRKVRIRPNVVRQVFREVYAGREIEEIYGRKARYGYAKGGYWRKETPLLRTPLPSGLRYGIITGRNRGETKLALRLCSLNGQVAPQAVLHTDHGMRKPDPRLLCGVLRHLKARRAVYVGDTRDDLLLVNNYRQKYGQSEGTLVFSCRVGHLNDLGIKPDLEAADVNELLGYLRTRKPVSPNA